jgi:flagellar hook assembly protein FlgD
MSTSVTNALANPVGSAAQANAAGNSSQSSNPTSADSLSTEFLQLLIAQLQNQDPENPTDGTTFVTQLAEFTGVQEQTQSTADLGSILNLIQAADPAAVAAAAAASAASPATNPATGGTAPAASTPVTGT